MLERLPRQRQIAAPQIDVTEPERRRWPRRTCLQRLLEQRQRLRVATRVDVAGRRLDQQLWISRIEAERLLRDLDRLVHLAHPGKLPALLPHRPGMVRRELQVSIEDGERRLVVPLLHPVLGQISERVQEAAPRDHCRLEDRSPSGGIPHLPRRERFGEHRQRHESARLRPSRLLAGQCELPSRSERHRQTGARQTEPRICLERRPACSFSRREVIGLQGDPRMRSERLARPMLPAQRGLLERRRASRQGAQGQTLRAEQIDADLVRQRRKRGARSFLLRFHDRLGFRDLRPARGNPPLPFFQPHLASDHVRRPERARKLESARGDGGVVEPQVTAAQHRVELFQGKEIVPVCLHQHIDDRFGDRDSGGRWSVAPGHERHHQDGLRREQQGEQHAHGQMLPASPRPR